MTTKKKHIKKFFKIRILPKTMTIIRLHDTTGMLRGSVQGLDGLYNIVIDEDVLAKILDYNPEIDTNKPETIHTAILGIMKKNK
jgi:hypothetical protein